MMTRVNDETGRDRIVTVEEAVGDREVAESLEKALDLKLQQTYSERLSAISHFTTTVAARLNDLLTPIVCYAQLLMQSGESGRSNRALRKILSAANEAKTIMDGLLDFTGRQPRHKENLELSRIVRETAPIAAEILEMDESEIVLEEEPALPTFQGDPHQMVQVVLHLIRNAVEATRPDQRPITVRTYLLRKPDSPSSLALEVEDRGRGISSRDLPKILLPFFSSHPEERVGLGLSIVYGVVQAHGGDIEIESRVGQGTCVRLLLPLSS